LDLNLHGLILQGLDKVPVKAKLINKYGPRAINNWDMTKVEVQAKSRHGAGLLSLMVNRSESLTKTVPGTPEAFDSISSGYSLITLHPSFSHRGNHQRRVALLTDGLIKIKNIEVILKKPLPPNALNIQGIPAQIVKTFKVDKIIGSSKTIHLNSPIKGIKLIGEDGKVRVNKVTLNMHTGQKIILDEIDGTLKKNKTKGVILPRDLVRSVKSITVSGTSGNLFGSRAKMSIALIK